VGTGTLEQTVAGQAGDSGANRPGRLRRWIPLALVLLALAPILVLIARAAGIAWHPDSDLALIELRTRDVGTRYTPLLGPYSRFAWSHPGPLLYYVLAVPYRILGSNGRAMLLGALSINGAAIAGSVVVLLRRGGIALMLLGVCLLALLTRSLGGQFLWTVWNPYVPVLAFFLLVLLAWSVSVGDWWCLPFAVAVGSFAMQSHVGFAIAVVVVLVAALALALFDRDARAAPTCRRALITGAVVGVVLWIPPVAEQLTNRNGGNLHLLFNFWFSHHTTPGVVGGYRVVAQYLAPWSPWLGRTEGVNPFNGQLVRSAREFPLAPLLVLVAAWLAHRAKARDAFRLAVLTGLVMLAAWYSASRITGGVDNYLVRWFWTIGPLSWLAFGAAILAQRWSVPARGKRAALVVSAVGGLALLVVVSAAALNASGASVPGAADSRALAFLGPQMTRYLHHPGETVRLSPEASFGALAFRVGVADELERAGYQVSVEKSLATRWGSGLARGATGRVTLLVAFGDQIERIRVRPGTRLVASYDRLTPSQHAELTALSARLQHAASFQQLSPSVIVSPEFQRLLELKRDDYRVAVFATT
jgi:hypothetical protein